MKARTVLIAWILSSTLLIALSLFFDADSLYAKRLEMKRVANIQKVCMKESPRKRVAYHYERSIESAQGKIDRLLEEHPLLLSPLSSSEEEKIENNASVETTPHQNRIVLTQLLNITEHVRESIALEIDVHTEKSGLHQEHLKHSQREADRLKTYIRERSRKILVVTAIGYGEEIPCPNGGENNGCIEMRLKRIE